MEDGAVSEIASRARQLDPLLSVLEIQSPRNEPPFSETFEIPPIQTVFDSLSEHVSETSAASPLNSIHVTRSVRRSINEMLPLQPDGKEIGPPSWLAVADDASSISDLSEMEEGALLTLEQECNYQTSALPKKGRKTIQAFKTVRKPRNKDPKRIKPFKQLAKSRNTKPLKELAKSRNKKKDGIVNRKLVILKIAANLLKGLRKGPSKKAQTKPRSTKRKRNTDSEDKAEKKIETKKQKGQTPAKNQTPLEVGLLTPTSETELSEPSQISLDHVDPAILELSRSLTARLPVCDKSEPSGSPLVWADSRQALCETVPYFKMPQGGCHQFDGHVYSFLYDGVGHCREYMDSDIIIARAGGGMEWDDSAGQGQMVQKRNHLMTESQVQAVQNDILLQNPLVVISGDRNQCALIKMPHKYCVMGWYKPISVWEEKTAGRGKRVWTTVKYRFERLNESEAIWHIPKESTRPISQTDRDELSLNEKNCKCGRTFPQVYLLGWMCLNSACDQFWKLEDNKDAPYGVLDYNPAFLFHRTPWEYEAEPYSVIPRVPNTGRSIGDHLTHINTRGVCCPECGRCNPRYLFRGWKCDTCSWELMSKHQPLVPTQLHQPWDSTGHGPSLAADRYKQSIVPFTWYTHGYKVIKYQFEGIEGCLVHAIANNRTNEESSGPNTMLEALQTEDIGLERRRFKVEKLFGPKAKAKPEVKQLPRETFPSNEELIIDDTTISVPTGDFMTAFSMNYGMPYKFVATGASQSFDCAPNAVKFARSKLNWAANTFIHRENGDKAVSFNEELIFAYMEGQKIEYHDDGEDGLGPCIATLSLGGKAKMSLRMKQKHYVGCSQSGVFTPDRPVPGGITNFKDRLEAWKELQDIKTTDRPLYMKRVKEIPKELGLLEKRGKKAENLVDITLKHGDIVIMDGYEIQKYLEHKVVPEGYLRFALTCRTILEGHLKPEERPAYEVKDDDYGYDGSELL